MKSKLPVLEKLGITHIVCVRQDIEANFIKPNFPQKFRYLVFDIADNPVENIIRYFPREYEAIYLARLTIQMMSPLQLGRSFSVQAGTAGQSRYLCGCSLSRLRCILYMKHVYTDTCLLFASQACGGVCGDHTL
ncbi:UNVERIFIED_CONTAM: hypothetical protein FKN15_019732 [Acipenser sinensis]